MGDVTVSNEEARPDTRHSGAQKVYFVCFTEPASASLEEIEKAVPDHKKWAAEAEAAGQFFVAGPFLDEDYRYTGSGMIVVRARTYEEAEAVVATDPMHARGLRTFRLARWQLNEGRLPVHLRLSDGSFTFD